MNKLSYGIANLISRKEEIYRTGYQFRFVSLFVLICFNFTVISIYIYIYKIYMASCHAPIFL